MIDQLQEAWRATLTSPLMGVALTLAAYQLAQTLWNRTGRRPWLNPVLVAVVLIGGFLQLVDLDYDDYMRGGSLVALLLGPATVALAWPLHRELALVRRAAVPVLVGIVVGAGVAVAAALLATTLAGGSEELALSMAPTSTTPRSRSLSPSRSGAYPLSRRCSPSSPVCWGRCSGRRCSRSCGCATHACAGWLSAYRLTASAPRRCSWRAGPPVPSAVSAWR